MKKIFSIIIAAVFVVSTCAVAVSARSYNPNGVCDIKFDVKRADPANVIKDGIIGENEYERYYPDLSPDSSCLDMVFGDNSSMYTYAEEMLATMEYYFSWDEVHGFNFAVKCKPPVYEQNIPQGTGDKPRDEFLCNLGLQVEFSDKQTREVDDGPLFYYAISKNAQTGEYYEGHYNQLGKKGAYDPAPGVDYEIAFNADGTILYEWSIALDNFTSAPTQAGSNVYFTVAALAGTDTVDETYIDSYGVSFGDWGFYVASAQDHSQAIATLSDETIGGAAPSGDTTNPGTQPGGDDTTPGTDNPGTEPGKNTDPVDSNNPGVTDPADSNEPVVTDPENPTNPENPTPSNPSNGNKAPSTADPIVIMAIASAVSACGFAVSKKRK